MSLGRCSFKFGVVLACPVGGSVTVYGHRTSQIQLQEEDTPHPPCLTSCLLGETNMTMLSPFSVL